MTSPFSARAMPSPFSARTCSSSAPVPSTAGSAFVYSSIAASQLVLLEQRVGPGEDRLCLRAVVGRDAAREEARVDARAGARATRPSRRSGASCRARSARCTPSRSGRRRGRSGSGPAATRSWRRRSPRRGARGALGGDSLVRREESYGSAALPDTSPKRNPLNGTVPQKGHDCAIFRSSRRAPRSLDRAT